MGEINLGDTKLSELSKMQGDPQYRATMEQLALLKKVSPTGVDYWRAREILPVLGYARWENFQEAIKRAKAALEGTGADPSAHFRDTTKVMKVGRGAEMTVPDAFLTRTACYLVAMNGDSRKPEIAGAQAYFTVQTRRMEQRDEADAQIAHDERRLDMRAKVSQSFRRVSGVAQDAGVRSTSQQFFHGARYRNLYGMPLKDILQKKGLAPNENLMDRAGPFELSTNDFQMNLAAEVIARENINDEQTAIRRNGETARRVRDLLVEHGSAMPEDLPAEPPIKQIASRVKAARRLK